MARCSPVSGSQIRTVRSLARAGQQLRPATVTGHTAQTPAPVAFQDGALLAGLGVPDPHRAVAAGAGQQLLAGHGDRAHRPDAALVAFQDGALLAGSGVPDPHGAVAAGAGQRAPSRPR